MSLRTSIGALLFFLCTGNAFAQQNDIDATDIYYRALRNYIEYERSKPSASGEWNEMYLRGNNITTRNIPDTVDGCAVTVVWEFSELQRGHYTIHFIDRVAWKDGGFEIRIRRENGARKGRKQFIAYRWSYFPLSIVWDTAQERFVLVPDEDDIRQVLGNSLY